MPPSSLRPQLPLEHHLPFPPPTPNYKSRTIRANKHNGLVTEEQERFLVFLTFLLYPLSSFVLLLLSVYVVRFIELHRSIRMKSIQITTVIRYALGPVMRAFSGT